MPLIDNSICVQYEIALTQSNVVIEPQLIAEQPTIISIELSRSEAQRGDIFLYVQFNDQVWNSIAPGTYLCLWLTWHCIVLFFDIYYTGYPLLSSSTCLSHSYHGDSINSFSIVCRCLLKPIKTICAHLPSPPHYLCGLVHLLLLLGGSGFLSTILSPEATRLVQVRVDSCGFRLCLHL